MAVRCSSLVAMLACAAVVMAMVQGSTAKEVWVGGPLNWQQSPYGDPKFYQDFIDSEFPIRSTDALLFQWAEGDSVMFVSKDDFDTCNAMHPIMAFTTQHFVRFPMSGLQNRRLFFMSGAPGHCAAGQKFYVDVYPAA